MLALKQGEGKDFWANKPPNSRYPTGGILFEGLGVIVKSDHHKTGNGFIYSHSKAMPPPGPRLLPPPSPSPFPPLGGEASLGESPVFLGSLKMQNNRGRQIPLWCV